MASGENPWPQQSPVNPGHEMSVLNENAEQQHPQDGFVLDPLGEVFCFGGYKLAEVSYH